MDPCPILVGRQQEMATLRQLLDAGGGVAIVSGEAGIGKSRLVREFAAIAAQRGRVIVWGRPEQVAQPGPYALILDLIEGIAEKLPKASSGDARALASELGGANEDGRPVPSARAVAAEIRGVLSRLSSPPVVFLEDLQGADEASHSVVLHLARAAADDGHVVVGTVRSESARGSASLSKLLDTLTRDRLAVEINLAPLQRPDVAIMLEVLWGRAPSDDELNAMQRLGEGVPFFVEELAQAQSEGASVPKSVEQSVAARMQALGEEGTAVLRAAGLLTGPIDVDVIAAACGLTKDAVATRLNEADKAGLISDDNGTLAFRHALIKASIGSSMSSLESSRLHGKIARAIEQVHPKTLDLAAQALSVHYREADEPERAAEYAIKAGERALTFAALEEARLEFQSAIDLTRGDSTQAFLGLAEVELRDGNEKGAATLFRQAADQLIARSENILAARALGRLAWSLLRIVDPEEIAHALDEGMELLSSDSKSEELARLKIQKGNMLTFFFGRDEDAKPILMDAVTVAESVGDKALVAEAFDGLAGVAQLQNQWEDALALGSSAIAAASASGDIEAIGRTHNNHAIVLALLGRTEEALRVLAEGRAPLERAHGRASVAALDVTRAWVAYLLGAPDEVAALTARGQAAWQRWRAYRRFLEVWVAQSQGQFELADSMMRAAWQEAGGSDARTLALTGGDRADRDAGLLLHAELLVHLSNRRIRESIELAPRLIEVYRRVGEPFEIAQAICLMARAFFDANRLDDAQGTLLELTNLRRTFPVVNASALEIEAMISASRGSYDTAREILKSAIDVHVSYGNVGDRARCERLVGQILIKEGSEEAKSQAKAYFRSSLSLADSAGTTHESRLAEGELRSLGIRPRAGRPRKSQEASDGLSPRETEVATLVAAGATNAEIASRLFLSERTVQDHMTHALRKLRLPSRAALASWAVKHGMI